MPILANLPGRPGNTNAAFFRNPTQALKGLREFDAVVQADNNGSITVWKGHPNQLAYHCERQVRCVTRAAADLNNQRELREWLKEQIPLTK